jgi:hypothetical protein
MIPKPLFVASIECIRLQMAKNKRDSELLKEAFNTNASFMHDDSLIIKGIIELLHYWFPIDSEGFSEIEHFCFFTDFGKLVYESTEDFFDRLIKLN